MCKENDLREERRRGEDRRGKRIGQIGLGGCERSRRRIEDWEGDASTKGVARGFRLFSYAFLKSHVKKLMKARLLTTLLAPENYFARSIRDDELGGVVGPRRHRGDVSRAFAARVDIISKLHDLYRCAWNHW